MEQTVRVSANLENTAFLCSATGNPQPVIQWIRNGTTISSNKDYQITSSTPEFCPMFTGCVLSTKLIILDTEPHDQGEYICIASNVVGSDMSRVELTVNGMIFLYHSWCKMQCNTFTPQIKGIPKPCIPHHKDTSQCTPLYIEMYSGKVVALQKVKPLSSKQGLP